MFTLDGIDHIALTVRDLGRSLDWYRNVLGLQRRHADVWHDYPAVVGIGTTSIALFPAAPDAGAAAGRGAIGMRHIAFRADAGNFRRAQDELQRQGIAFEFQDHQIAHSIYVRDPDGHEIEITTYEVE